MSVNLEKHGRLHCLNGYIVDENDEKFLLKGFGLGGWLVPEGYMLHTKAPSPTTIYNAFKDLIGKKDSDKLFKEYFDNYVNEKDIEILSKLDINSIRLPFHYKMLSKEYGTYDERGFEILDMVLEWCTKYGLYLILDMHCAPGSQNGQNISDDLSGIPNLYLKKKNLKWCRDIWAEIAKRYKDNDVICGYDLINEPVITGFITNKELLESYIYLTEGIREVGDTHMVFIEGNHYATDFKDMDVKYDAEQVFSFHKYWNKTDLESIKDRSIDLREKTGCPIWMGESGENSNEWFYETIILL